MLACSVGPVLLQKSRFFSCRDNVKTKDNTGNIAYASASIEATPDSTLHHKLGVMLQNGAVDALECHWLGGRCGNLKVLPSYSLGHRN